MKLLISLLTFLTILLASAVSNANVQVFFTNNSGLKGQLAAEAGTCGDGRTNMWQSQYMGNGKAAGTLPCPIRKSFWNNGYYMLMHDLRTKCAINFPDDASTILKNGYTKVYVTATPGRPCNITRTFAK